MAKKRNLLTERFIPGSHISCSATEQFLLDINKEKNPKTVRSLIDSLPGVIQTHIATCGRKHSCLNLASVLVEANQLQPIPKGEKYMNCDEFKKEVDSQYHPDSFANLADKANSSLGIAANLSPEADDHIIECDSCLDYLSNLGDT